MAVGAASQLLIPGEKYNALWVLFFTTRWIFRLADVRARKIVIVALKFCPAKKLKILKVIHISGMISYNI